VKNARAGRIEAPPLPIADSRGAVQVAVDYLSLAKPRLNLLVVATSAAGFYLGSPGAIDVGVMAQAVAGTALVAGGAAALNQVYERETDALMRRTRKRPLPDGRLGPTEARTFGIALAAAGIGLLALSANLTAALLALLTLLVYVIVYTPMKRRSTASTLVGAVPGALPPLIGWTAAVGSTSMGGWALFAIVFLWQIPHFMAIAWMYRDDYGAAGFPMLAVLEPDGRRTGQQAVLYAAALLPASLVPTLVGVSGLGYFWTALVLGSAMLGLAGAFALRRTESAARALFYGSITYLPLLWAAMILDSR
jgi:protoheme IX farnesyltransferase